MRKHLITRLIITIICRMHNCGAVAIGGITSSTLFELFPLFFLFKVDSMMNSNWVLFKGPLPSDYPFIYMLIQGDASKARFNARKTITRDMPLKQTRGETVPELACSTVAVNCRNQSPVCSCWFSRVKNNC